MPFPKADKTKTGEKAKQPHKGIPLCKETMLTLIKEYGGNVSKVADVMGSTRYTVQDRCMSDPDLKQALSDARERWLDRVEQSVLQRAADMQDTALQCFVLKTQGRHRGWEQDEVKTAAQDIAKAAFEFVLNKSKNPAERN